MNEPEESVLSDFPPLPKIPNIPEERRTPEVAVLLELVTLQQEQIQLLRDEIARLKGLKPKPEISPSKLREDAKKKRVQAKKKTAKKPKAKKRESLPVHDTVVCSPEHIPVGSRKKGYRDFFVQDIQIQSFNTLYRQECWQTPDGEIITGKLPDGQQGSHFGPELKRLIIYLYFQCHTTQPLIHEFLLELGVDISTGQINTILSNDKERFHEEKDEILQAGLTYSPYIQVDDTGARHRAKNGYCTQIGNDVFTWFKSTESKSRINFLELLQGGNICYSVTPDALEYMARAKLPKAMLEKLSSLETSTFSDYQSWIDQLTAVGITQDRHVRIAVEGALLGGLEAHGFNRELIILSDGARQFNILTHALCWVHGERNINKLVGFTDAHRAAREEALSSIWDLYKELKEFKKDPTADSREKIEKTFDEVFTKKSGYASLDLAMGRIYANKSEMLLVLDYPFLPLHNNLSENDIREYVKRRKVSGATRSEDGRKCRDTFTSLKKTCRKLGVSFWGYLGDRISDKFGIPKLATLVKDRLTDGAPA